MGNGLAFTTPSSGTTVIINGLGTGSDGGTINDMMPHRHESNSSTATPQPVMTSHLGRRLTRPPMPLPEAFAGLSSGMAVPLASSGPPRDDAIRCFCIRAFCSLFFDIGLPDLP